MEIGICGKPNSGKSTFFSAATLIDVPMADYPFTTIDPNIGLSYVRTNCVCKEFGVKCNPKHGRCVNGIRFIPTKLVDVAGLVPGAHEGKGLGNRFLTDLAGTDCLIQVVDASGRTDLDGRLGKGDPVKEVMFLEEELVHWIDSILERHWRTIKSGNVQKLVDITNSLKVSEETTISILKELDLKDKKNWSPEDRFDIARLIVRRGKPILIAANKVDEKGADENIERLKEAYPDKVIVPTYALGELVLRKAAKNGYIEYLPGDSGFEVIRQLSKEQKTVLDRIREILDRYGGSGVQQILNKAVFDVLGYIVVYPVENEKELTDSQGNVLPDAILMKKGSTVIDLAEKIHSDIAEGFIGAIDVRTGRKVGRDHMLKDRDVIKIMFK